MIIRSAARTKRRIGITDWYCPADEAEIWEKVVTRMWQDGPVGRIKILKGTRKEPGRTILFHSKFDDNTKQMIADWRPIPEDEIDERCWLMLGDDKCDELRYKYSHDWDLAVSDEEKNKWIDREQKASEAFMKAITHEFY